MGKSLSTEKGAANGAKRGDEGEKFSFQSNGGKTLPAEANRVGIFLQRRLLMDAGRIKRLVIRHVVNSRPGELVDSYDDATMLARVTEADIPVLAMAVYNCAANNAEGRDAGREQQYILQAFAEEDPSGEAYSLPFRVAPQRKRGGGGDGYVDSYSPDENGIIGMLMSFSDRLMAKQDAFEDHFGAMIGQLVEAQAVQSKMQRELITELSEENKRLREGSREDVRLIDEARSSRWEHERADRIANAEIHSKQEILGILKAAVPPVLRRIGAGNKDAEVKLAPEEVHAYTLAKSMSEEQVVKILGPDSPLDEKQKFLFADMLKFFGEQEEKKAAADARGQAPVPSQGA